MSKLEITKEKVLKAAKECPDAKKVLKGMFPEAFEDEKYFDLLKLNKGDYTLFESKESRDAGFNDYLFFQIRGAGIFGGKSFYLNKSYNWDIITDNEGEKVLLPTRKDC